MDQTKQPPLGQTLTDADRAALDQAKATADMLMGPVFAALGVKDAKGLAQKQPARAAADERQP